MKEHLPPKWTSPSAKVITATLMALIAGLVSALAADTSVLEPLPDWLEAVAAGALVGLAGYMKRETNPAPPPVG